VKTLFPYFGGKSSVSGMIWERLGTPKQYIEPFFGSGAVLFNAPNTASLEVIGDANGFVANFWRCAKHQPAATAEAADYPVSHVDLGARHVWLMSQRDRLGAELQDPDWPGDAKVAGWWLWGQCSWIGSGWCDWFKAKNDEDQIPHVSDAGRGLLTTGGAAAWDWLHKVAARLERVRVVHGAWSRCLNNRYGADDTAVFLDPPYRAYEAIYGASCVADEVEAWAKENASLRVCLAGHVGDYPTLEGWDVVQWDRGRLTYSGAKTTDKEALWFSPACLKPSALRAQPSLFGGAQ